MLTRSLPVVACSLLLAAALPAAEVRSSAAPAHTSGTNQSSGVLQVTSVVNEQIRTSMVTVGTLKVRHGFILAKPTPAPPVGNG